MSQDIVGRGKTAPNSDEQPIGDRPLTPEEQGNASLIGLSEEEARKYSPMQLSLMAQDWYEVWGMMGRIYVGC